jgi:hypothetical protein
MWVEGGELYNAGTFSVLREPLHQLCMHVHLLLSSIAILPG